MKTPEEIKNGLKCQLHWFVDACDMICSKCELNAGTSTLQAMRDALDYIDQLENQIGVLVEKVAQLEAAQPRWNNIAGRPPEEELKKYLVAFQSNGKYVIDTAFYNAEYGFTLGHWIPGDITHWMYAPEPPKE